MRTNIVIDDELLAQAKVVSGLKTKKAVVELALKELVENKQRLDLRELLGKIELAEDYDYKSLRRRKP